MKAIIIPRQIDFTGNFLFPQSPWVHTLRVIRENSVLITFRILRNQRKRIKSFIFWLQPYIRSCQGSKPFMVCGGSYDLLAPIRWSTKIIVQRMKPLIHKDSVSKACRYDKLFGHRTLKFAWGCLYPTPTLWARLLRSLKSPLLYGVGLIHPQTPLVKNVANNHSKNSSLSLSKEFKNNGKLSL